MNKLIYDLDNNLFIDKIDGKIYHFKDFKKNLTIKKFFFYLLKIKEVQIISNYPLNDLRNLSLKMILFLTLISKSNLKINNRETKYSDYNFFLLSIKWLLFNCFKAGFFEKIVLLLIKKKIKKINFKSKKIKNKNIIYLLIDNVNFEQGYGGRSAHINGILNEFSKRFENVHIFTNQELNYNFKNIKLHKLRKNYFNGESLLSRYFTSIEQTKEITAILEKKNIKLDNIEFIYTRFALTSFVSYFLSMNIYKPLVIEYNGSESWISKFWNLQNINYSIENKLENILLEFSFLISVVSKPLIKELNKRIKNKNICLIPNGVSFNEIKKIKINKLIRKKLNWQNDTILCFSGSFGPWHGTETLAKAYKYIKQTNPNCNIKLIFIGAGPKIFSCKKILKNFSNKDVYFHGKCHYEENISLLKDCDILISPQIDNIDGSTFFGSPTKIFEYMSLRKIVVVSDVGDIPDYVKKNIDGFIFKNNNFKELASIILEIHKNTNKYNYMRRLSEIKAKNQFNWSNRVTKLINYF